MKQCGIFLKLPNLDDPLTNEDTSQMVKYSLADGAFEKKSAFKKKKKNKELKENN